MRDFQGWIPDFRLSFDTAYLYVETKSVESFEALWKEPELLRAARCADRFGLPILAVGPELWGSDHPQMDVIGVLLTGSDYYQTVYVDLIPGTKRWVSTILCTLDERQRRVPLICGVSDHFRDSQNWDRPTFEIVWKDCLNAGMWKPGGVV